jgi:hypothetical protein
MERSKADSIFYDALRYKHVNSKDAYKYWAAVRVFGRSHFNQGVVCEYGLAANSARMNRNFT